MGNPFNVMTTLEDTLAVLEIDGYLDAHTAPQFEQAIQDEIDAGHNRIIVDCAGLTYISSAGLGVFMGFVEEVRDKEGDIKICGLTAKVRQVFDMLGFEQLYHILETREDAVRKFEETPTWKG